MSLSSQVKGDIVTITIVESFDVSLYEQFKEAYLTNLTETSRFIIDLDRATYMDSSALGMLLLLREKTSGDKSRVKLINVSQNVFSILKIAQFQQLFDIQLKA